LAHLFKDGEKLHEGLIQSAGNALHTVLAIVQRAARIGDAEAGKVIKRLAQEHASASYERGELL
jgi:hypothetical protein